MNQNFIWSYPYASSWITSPACGGTEIGIFKVMLVGQSLHDQVNYIDGVLTAKLHQDLYFFWCWSAGTCSDKRRVTAFRSWIFLMHQKLFMRTAGILNILATCHASAIDSSLASVGSHKSTIKHKAFSLFLSCKKISMGELEYTLPYQYARPAISMGGSQVAMRQSLWCVQL